MIIFELGRRLAGVAECSGLPRCLAAGPKLLVACGGVALASRPAAQRIGPAGLAAKWMRGAGGGGDMEWIKQRTDGGRVDGAESRRRRQPGDGVDGEQSSDLRVLGGGEPAIGGRERERGG